MRLIMRKSDVGAVQKCREILRHNLDLLSMNINKFYNDDFHLMILLQVKSNIAIQEDLARIHSKQQEILQAVKVRSHTPEQDRLLQTNGGANVLGGRGTPIIARSTSGSIALPGETSMPPSPLPPPCSKFNLSAVGQDQITTDSSHHVSNSNFGNMTITITKNSNNDSSVRVRGCMYRVS